MLENIFRALAGGPKAWEVFEPLKAAMALHSITGHQEVAFFLAQCAHECQGFTRLRENMNYSADGLADTWPSRFRGPNGKPNALALQLHRKPQAIANSVYANRMGNGPPESGHGWAYRGGGIKQLTGLDNFTRASLGCFGDTRLVDQPELITQPDIAALTSCWFWVANGLPALAKAGDVTAVTRRINGGTIGLADRRRLTNLALLAQKEQTA